MILTKNTGYHKFEEGKRLPFIDGVKISFIDNKKTEFLEFKNGNLDFVSGIDASYIDEVLDDNGNIKAELTGKMVLIKEHYLNTEYIGFQADSSIGSKDMSALRKALNISIDKSTVVKKLRKGIGVAAWQGITPPILYQQFALEKNALSYQPEEARKWLKSIHFQPDKHTITLYTNEANRDIAEFIIKSWENLGCSVKMEVVQPSLLREWMVQKKVSVFRASWIADYADPESYLSLFYSHMPAPPNYTHFQNAEYDELYESALSCDNDSARYHMYSQMEKILVDEMPVIPIYYDEVLRFVSPRIKNLGSNPMNLLRLESVKISD